MAPDDSAITALDKPPCPACGAQAEWNPARQLLACPFCGTESAFQPETDGNVEERDLRQALRQVPADARGWQVERRSVQCQSCRAVMVFAPERVGQNCEFCGSPSLIDYQEIQAPIRPESLLPFQVTETRVREEVRSWFAGKWLAPGAFKRKAMVDRLHAVYIPYWTFDAQAHCPWEAEAGYYYYVREEYRDAKGQRHTRQVQRVRWEWVSGAIDHFFNDELVPGTAGIQSDLLNAVEPFPTDQLVPYDPRFLAGFVVQQYEVPLADAARQARDAMHGQLVSMCAAQVPGDTQRNLSIDPRYTGQTFKHILVPVWLMAYTYGAKAYQLVANGVTGEMAGEYPKSFWKIALLVLLVLAIVGVVVLLSVDS